MAPLLTALLDYELIAAGDAERIALLRDGAAKGLTLAQVPQMPKDVYDLAGLKSIADSLFPQASSSEQVR